MSRAGHLLRRTAATALVLTGCGHYTAGEGPEPQLAPTPGAAVTSGAVATSGALPVQTPGTTAACDALVVASGTVVTERVHGAGACTPALGAVAYRCDPTFDPVVTIGLGGTPLRFLGGRFAVAAPAVPEGAVDLGVTSAGRLWLTDGGNEALYAEGSEGVRRWLPLPKRNAVTDEPQAVVIGDSLMDGSQEELVAALPDWSLAIDAEVGRGSFGAASVVEALPLPMPDVVVVEIGVNDADATVFASNLQRIADATDDPQLLVWLTGHGPDSTTDEVNRAIVAGMAAQPRGVVLDWDTLVPADALDPDGVHLLGDRQEVMATLIADRLTAWQEAASGEGATGCEGAVKAAARRVDGAS